MLKNTFNLKSALITTVAYIAIMGAGMFTMHAVMGQAYGHLMGDTILWAEVILSLLCIVYIARYSSWKEIGFGFGSVQWRYVLWLVPGFILIGYIWFDLCQAVNMSAIDSRSIHHIVIICLTTLLVGFSEEVMFRGILLRAALTQKGVFTSILISSAGFALLHAVNIFGGVSGMDIPFQLLNTFIFALFLAPLALRLGNLIPLIIFHWIWDFSILTTLSLDHNTLLPFIGAITNLIFAIILLWQMRNSKNKNINDEKTA